MAEVAGTGSPRAIARLTGLLYLFIIVAALFAEMAVRDRLVVSRDAVATAHNILSNEGLWRLGVAADVLTTVCDIAVAALLYILLRPVNRAGSATAAYFRLAYSVTPVVGAACLIAPLFLLQGAGTRTGFDLAQAQALALYSIRLHGALFNVGLVFFGVHLVITGVLIARSTFLPRWLGWGLAIAGACYAINSLAGFVAPALAAPLYPWILLPGFVAEGALTLWLLIAGLDQQRWYAAAGAAG